MENVKVKTNGSNITVEFDISAKEAAGTPRARRA